jgi:O-antigen/teichoic acid export membrane protein
MNSVQRSILFSAADRYGSLVLFFVATAILSRLLSPAEFGVYAVVNAVTTVIGASFQEFGGGNYLIQKRELSAADVRSAFTITLGISVAIALLLFVLAGALSELFAQDSLKRGIEVSALNFVLVPFFGTISALLRRDMKFGTLAICIGSRCGDCPGFDRTRAGGIQLHGPGLGRPGRKRDSDPGAARWSS